MFCSPDNGIDNIVGVEVTEDPDDGYEEHKQDHDGQDSPRKKDTIARWHTIRYLILQEVFF